MKITLEAVNAKKHNYTKMNQSLDDIIKTRQIKAGPGRANPVKTTTTTTTGRPKPITFNKPVIGNQKQPAMNKKPQQKQQQQQQTQKPQQQQQQNTQATKNVQPSMNQSTGPARLQVRNLGEKVTEADLFTLFKEFGEILEYSIHYDNNQQPIGSAHVVFMRFGDAMRGKRKYHNITLDGRAMNIYVSNIEDYKGNFTPLNPKPKWNNQTGMGQKPLKRLQKGPQPMTAQRAPQPMTAQRAPQPMTAQRAQQPIRTQRAPQQQSKWYVAGQSPMNVAPQLQTTKSLNLGLLPTPALGSSSYSLAGFGLNTMPSAGSFGGSMPRRNILARLGDVEEIGTTNGQTGPSVLDRLDGGASIISPVAPRIPSVFNRLDGATNSGKVVQVGARVAKPGAAAGGSILSRVGLNTGIQQRVGPNTGIQQRVGPNTGIQMPVAGQSPMNVAPQLQTTKSLNLGLLPTPGLGSSPYSLGYANPAFGLNTMPINAATKQWSWGQPMPAPTNQMKRGLPLNNQQQRGLPLNNQQQRGLPLNNQQQRGLQQVKKGIQQPQLNQPKKFKPQPQPVQQMQQARQKVKTPTAAELDAELDDYLSKMTK